MDYEEEVSSELIDTFGKPYEIEKVNYSYVSDEMDSLNSGTLDWDQYRFGRSLNGMKSYFTKVQVVNERNRDYNEIDSGNEVSATLKSILGINNSLLGELSERKFKPLKVENEYHLEQHDWTFESGAVLQFYLMKPKGKDFHERPMLALHGCSSSPDNILGLTEPYYSNNFGLEAVKKGWTVIAPYHLNICDLIERFDSMGALTSGTTLFGYELMLLAKLMDTLKKENNWQNYDVYGLSKGGQLAMYLSGIDSDIVNMVVSGSMIFNYQSNLLKQLSDFSSQNIRTGNHIRLRRYLDINELLINHLKNNSQNRLVLEYGAYDMMEHSNRKYAEYFKQFLECIQNEKIEREKLFVNFFKGYHEANPEPSLDYILKHRRDNK